MRKALALLTIFWILVLSTCAVFAQETKSQLTTRFDVIRNETAQGGNTKTRIANAYQELSDGMIGVYPVEALGTNTYTGSLVGLDAYNKRLVFIVFPNNNTGASTLNLNSIGASNIMKDSSGVWVALEADDIIASKLYRVYNDGSRWQIDLGGSGGGISGSGSADQIAVWDGTSSQTGFSTFTWDDTNKRFIAGNGTIGGGSYNFNFGNSTSIGSGSWNFTTSETSSLANTANNSFSSGWHNTIGDGSNAFSGSQSITTGTDNLNYGFYTNLSGIGGRIIWVSGDVAGGFVHSFSDPENTEGRKDSGIPYVTANAGAFNISRNTSSQTDGYGALARDGGILGGINNHLPVNSVRSVVIGGEAIVAPDAVTNTVFMPKFRFGLGTSASLTTDNTNNNVVVRNASTGEAELRSALTIGTPLESVSVTTTGGTVTLDFDLGDYDDAVQKMFIGSNTWATSKTLAFSNDTNARVFNFHFEVTNVAGTIVCSTCIMSDANWDSGSDTWTPAETGKYEMGGSWDGSAWKVKVLGPFN